MATLADLQTMLDKLEKARASGARSISYDGRMVTYRDVAELNDAIAQVRADIAAAGGSSIVRQFRFSSCKDL